MSELFTEREMYLMLMAGTAHRDYATVTDWLNDSPTGGATVGMILDYDAPPCEKEAEIQRLKDELAEAEEMNAMPYITRATPPADGTIRGWYDPESGTVYPAYPHDGIEASEMGLLPLVVREVPPADDRDLTAYEADALNQTLEESSKKVEHPHDAAVRELVGYGKEISRLLAEAEPNFNEVTITVQIAGAREFHRALTRVQQQMQQMEQRDD